MLKPNNRLRRTVAPMTPRLAGLPAAGAIATECAMLVVGAAPIYLAETLGLYRTLVSTAPLGGAGVPGDFGPDWNPVAAGHGTHRIRSTGAAGKRAGHGTDYSFSSDAWFDRDRSMGSRMEEGSPAALAAHRDLP